MHRVFLHEVPVEAVVVLPLDELPELAAHEEQFFARVHRHVGIKCAEICKLELALARHLADHG